MDLSPEPPSASQVLILRPPPKPNICDDVASAIAPPNATLPTDFLKKPPLPYKEHIKALKEKVIELIQGPLLFRLQGKLESWEGAELGVTLDQFHTACDIVFTALESGYYPTRSRTLLSATEWAELSSATMAAIGWGYCQTENSSKEEDIKEA